MREVHVRQVHVRQVHVRQVHVRQVHVRQGHVRQVHVRQGHVRQVHVRHVHVRHVHVRHVHVRHVHVRLCGGGSSAPTRLRACRSRESVGPPFFCGGLDTQENSMRGSRTGQSAAITEQGFGTEREGTAERAASAGKAEKEAKDEKEEREEENDDRKDGNVRRPRRILRRPDFANRRFFFKTRRGFWSAESTHLHDIAKKNKMSRRDGANKGATGRRTHLGLAWVDRINGRPTSAQIFSQHRSCLARLSSQRKRLK